MIDNKKQITILVRRGIPGGNAKYCACRADGTPIMGFSKLSDVRKYWQKEIKAGYVRLVRDLDKKPNIEPLDDLADSLRDLMRELSK